MWFRGTLHRVPPAERRGFHRERISKLTGLKIRTFVERGIRGIPGSKHLGHKVSGDDAEEALPLTASTSDYLLRLQWLNGI